MGRVRWAVVALCALLLVLPLTQVSTSAAAAKRSVSLATSSSMTTGAVVTVRGVLARSPKGSPVVVQRKVGTRWVKVVATRTATSSGSYVARFRAPQSGGTHQFRAEAPRWRSAPRVVSTTRSVVVRVQVRASLSAAPLTPAAGDPTTLTGAVTPWLAGTKVVLQRRVGTATTWSPLSVLTPDASGRFRTSLLPLAGATTRFRVTVAARGYRTSAVSAAVAVTPVEPGVAMGLRATSTGKHVALRWTNPSGTASVDVRYATGTAPPATPADGTALPLSAIASSVTHTSALIGVRYAYAVFVTTNDGTVIRATVDRPGPGVVSDVRTTKVPGKITFHWTNPPGVHRVVVDVIEGSGVPLYDVPPRPPPGTDIGTATSHTVSGLTSRETVGVQIYTLDAAGNYTGSVHSAATSLDGTDIPPPPVSSPTAAVTPSSITLRWTNPGHDDVIVARAEGSTAPSSPDPRSIVGEGSADGPFVDTTVEPGRTYSYTLWVVDSSGNHSTPARVTATTPRGTPPGRVTALTATALAPTPAVGTTGYDPARVRLQWTSPPGAVALAVSRAEGATAPASPVSAGGWNLLAPASTLLDRSLEADTTYTYAVWAIGADGSYSSVTTATVRSDPHRARPVSGLVVDPVSGQRMGGVPLVFRSLTDVHPTGFASYDATTEPDGTYAVDLPVGPYTVCIAGAAVTGGSPQGYVDSCSDLTVSSAASTTHDLVVNQAVSIHGVVRDATTGEPVAGVRIAAWRPSGHPLPFTATTAEDGSYVVKGISAEASPSTRVTVHASSATSGAPQGYEVSHPETWVSTAAPGAQVQHDLTITPLRTITIAGRVLDPSGAPVPGVGVHRINEAKVADGEPVVVTDQLGRYTFTASLGRNESLGVCFDAERHRTPGAATGLANQCAGGADFDPEPPENPTDPSAIGSTTSFSTTSTVDITLPRPGVVTGRVTAPGGAPLANATVQVAKYSSLAVGRVARTDAQGRFSIATRAPRSVDNPVQVCVDTSAATGGTSSTGYLPPPCVTEFLFEAATAEVDVVAQPAAAIAGTVREASTGAPLSGLVVELERIGDVGSGGSATTGPDGSYTLGAVLPKSGAGYRVCARGPDHTPRCSVLAELGVADVVGGSTARPTPLLVDAEGSVSGVLTGSDTGAPLAGVRVSLTTDWGWEAGWSTTDADGRYDIRGVPARTLLLRTPGNTLGPQGYHAVSGVDAPVEVSPGRNTVADLAMTPASAVRVRAITHDGRPIPAVELDAPLHDAYFQSVTLAEDLVTDAQGYVTVKGLAPTTYPQGNLCTDRDDVGPGTRAGYRTACSRLPVLTDGRTAAMTMVLLPRADFSVTVTDALSGERVFSPTITLTRPDGSTDVRSGAGSRPRTHLEWAKICATAIGYRPACFGTDTGDVQSAPLLRGRPGMLTIVPIALTPE